MDERTVSFTLPEIAKKFGEIIQKGSYDFRDDRVTSVLEFLYVTYADNQGRDPEKICQGFADLDNYLEKVSLDDNNAIFSLVCNLCNLYEERAFKDGLQLGAYLILALQGNSKKRMPIGGHSFLST